MEAAQNVKSAHGQLWTAFTGKSSEVDQAKVLKPSGVGSGCVWFVLVFVVIAALANNSLTRMINRERDTWMVLIVFVSFIVAWIIVRSRNQGKRRVYLSLLERFAEFQKTAKLHEQTLQKRVNGHISQAKSMHRSQIETIEKTFEQGVNELRPRFKVITEAASRLAPAWSAETWLDWHPSENLDAALRLGDMISISQEIFPALFPFPGAKGLLLKTSAAEREKAVQGVQSLLVRLLAAVPPSKLQFTFVDPVGRGQNGAAFLALGDYDPQLVTSRVWTEARHIEQQLSDLTEHMENVIQKYLRNEFATIEDYNEQAEEIAEPYRFLVIFDFPVNFNEEACRRLVSIAENGPRCGVYTVVLHNIEQSLPYGVDLADLEHASVVIQPDGEHFVWRDEVHSVFSLTLDTPPEKPIFDRIIKLVGEKAQDDAKVEVPFRKIIRPSEEWWTWKSDDGLRISLGPSGARKIQYLELGQGTSQHVLVVGRTGSGKSTLLHTLITSLALHYTPDEAELYLIDLKKGVEFKTYATHKLPHARVIAIESEREFALSVLEGLDAEMERRGKLYKAHEVDGLKDYRAKSGEKQSRILLLIDEFQELFTEDDNVARTAQQILDRLVRQGRAFGIHVMLGSQTLAGSYSLTRSTLDQMAVRIALQSTEADSRLILADDNPAARLLSRPGEAIYNSATGLVEGNNLFQVAWLTDDERDAYLQQIATKFQLDGASRHQIVFEGNASARIEDSRPINELLRNQSDVKTSLSNLVYLGEPVAIRESVSAKFRRQSGCNLLLVTRNEEEARGMFASMLISLLTQIPETTDAELAPIYMIDFVPVDSPHAHVLKAASAIFSHDVKIGRRNQLQQYLAVIEQEVEKRLENEESAAPPVYLMIYGLQKARDIRQDDDMTFGYGDDASDTPSPSKQLSTILRQGPEVGVFTIVWCDTVSNLNRSLERRLMREFGMRSASQMSADDSVELIDTPAASKLGAHRALFYDDEENRLEKMRPYLIPDEMWLKKLQDKSV